MFLLRSAFWLTAAFIVIAPTTGADLGVVAQNEGERIAQQGRELAAASLDQIQCESIECTIGRAVAIGALAQTAKASQSSISPMQDAPSVGPAPVPPPRPDWAG